MWSRYHKDDWPERIVYYRDGVAESQLEQVTTSEVTAIRSQLSCDQLKDLD